MINQLLEFFGSRETPVYLVGGYVRDRLLSRPTDRDIDLAVGGDALAIAAFLAPHLGGSLVPLSPSRGSVRVVVKAASHKAAGLDSQVDRHVDPEQSGPDDDGPQWTVDLTGYSGSIEEELERRDFTINSMALPLARWDDREALLDPLGGLADLARKQIRALGSGIFESDPGRLLRAMRLSSQLRFRLEPETVRLVASNAHRLSDVSADRVRDEFLRIMSLNGAKGQLEAMDRLGLLRLIIPELEATKGVDQPRMHYWDVWGHTLHAVETAELVTQGHQNSSIYFCVPWCPESAAYFNQTVTNGHNRRTVLKLAALFHDIAKPQTKTVDATGRTRFFGHPEQGAETAARRLRRLRVSSRGTAMVSRMVEEHLRPTNMMRGQEWPSNRAIYRFFRDVGEVATDTIYLCLADYLAAKGPELSHPEWLDHARMMTHILHVGATEPVSPATVRLVTGRDLMERLGLDPGPRIGSLLEAIEEARAAGEIESAEQALELAAQTLQNLED